MAMLIITTVLEQKPGKNRAEAEFWFLGTAEGHTQKFNYSISAGPIICICVGWGL